MADDRMKNDDLKRNMGTKDREEFGQQTPGRSGQGGRQGDPNAGSQQGGQFGQKGSRDLDEDDDIGAGSSGKTGGQNRGGQNR